MRITNIERVRGERFTELRATVSSPGLATPFDLWFRVPPSVEPSLGQDIGDAFIPALLLPAMKLGEPLEIPAPISPRLLHATRRIQTMFKCWEPRLDVVDVRAPERAPLVAAAKEIGLFYSGGVDSSYSLTKNLIDHPLNEDVISHLITIHGIDIRIDDPKIAVYDQMLEAATEVAQRLGKGLVKVATNVQDLMQMVGIPWGGLGHGAGLASIGLVLQHVFRKLYIAPAGSYLMLRPNGSHPLLDPLWSTEDLTFIHDGSEATRLERIRLLVRHPIVLDKLHVCWDPKSRQFNCGHCSKCLLAMVTLHLLGGAKLCPTLPQTIGLDTLRRVELVISGEANWIGQLLEETATNDGQTELRETLAAVRARSTIYFDRLDRATRTLRRLIPGRRKFILVDEEAIREKIGVGIPFMERAGVFVGNPPDDETAIHELERLRGEGADFLALWYGEFWYLDFYSGLNRHLSRFPRIWNDDSLMIFDLRPVSAAS